MPDFTAKVRMRNKHAIPRIEPKDAARIFAKLERLLEDSGGIVAKLRLYGFGQFLEELEEPALELAVQPDSWGERTRARLVSAVMSGVKGLRAESATVQEIVEVSNLVMPGFLLELGRRRGHIAVEFPKDPCNREARYGLGVAPSRPILSVMAEQIVRLVTHFGEDLVGLCYFGDRHSRDAIEAELNRTSDDPNAKARPCRTLASSSIKPKR